VQGDTGADSTVQGDTGSTGDTGIQDDTGVGTQGDTGTSGDQGDTGEQGDTGSVSNEWNIDSTPDSDHTVSGIIGDFTANENQAFGDVCYIDADGEMHLADADAIASAVVIGMCADASINASASGDYLLFGIARDDTWAWTVGGLVYLSLTGTTTNTLTQTAPSATDDCIVIVGVATHADRIFFNPQLVIVEHT